MADEAVLVYEIGHPIPFVIASVEDAIAVTKGTLMKLSGSLLASSLMSASNDKVAGIAASDKIASDGVLSMGIYRSGIFRMRASGSITFGDPVGSITAYQNYVASQVGTLTLSGSRTLGTALNTVTNGQYLLVDVNPAFGWVAV